MPTVRNRTDHPLNVSWLGVHLGPGEQVHVTDEQAALVEGHRLLDIKPDKKPANKNESGDPQ